MKRLFYIYIAMIITGCGKEEVKYVHKYFDIAGYFKSEAATLEKNQTEIKKTITKNGESETNSSKADWNKELKPFADCDINSPAWINSYSIDSVIEGNIVTLKYEAVEERAPVRKILITLKNNIPTKISMWRMRKNFYYSVAETYSYHPDGYTIEGKQKVHFMDEINYVAEASFIF